MNYFCTLSDKNYLSRGLCLIDSLTENSSEDFAMYYLCLDYETYRVVSEFGDNVVAISLDEIEREWNVADSLLNYKNVVPYNEYCWALASTFSRYVLEVLEKSSVMYIDSDIYFYKDPQIILEELGDNSVGIIRHRHNTNSSPDGEYNVGVVCFKNDPVGTSCLNWWNDAILNFKYPELRTCGDQKFLERFVPLFGEDCVCVLDETFAHGAPWNYRLYVYDEYGNDGCVIWGDKKQPFVFNHFSRLDYDDEKIIPAPEIYRGHTLNFGAFEIPVVKKMYIDYVERLRRHDYA
tara:strand:- start:4047 stop:4922 length:876 start_codon:yes stop_codon:yes gene_type:complete